MNATQLAMRVGYGSLAAFVLMGVAPAVALADGDPTQAAISQHHEFGNGQKNSRSELVKVVRQVTARFQDAAAAEAESYALHFGCVSGPDQGAMGLHYVNMDLVLDGELDATRPEIVIYEPLPGGRLRLIGADYLVLADAWHAKNANPPELMGQLLHLFESPNRFGLPAFYTLHVWAWKDNPSGMFVNWHTKVSCEAFDGSGD